MISFKNRSNDKELLDGKNIPFSDIKVNLEELEVINHLLGGHAITLQGFSEIINLKSSINPVHIAEIGCGGGDNLRFIKKNVTSKYRLNFTGIDFNRECISFAEGNNKNEGIEFICSDYKDYQPDIKPDIIFCSLFCHHFGDEELVNMLRWMDNNCTAGFFINDLHRHFIPYFSIKLVTSLFSKSYLIKNDAPISVRRGFIKKDWEKLFHAAGINDFTCKWKWAFRWLIISTKNNGSSEEI